MSPVSVSSTIHGPLYSEHVHVVERMTSEPAVKPKNTGVLSSRLRPSNRARIRLEASCRPIRSGQVIRKGPHLPEAEMWHTQERAAVS